MARDCQREQKMRRNYSWTSAGATNIRKLSGVTTGKTLNSTQAGQETSIQHAGLGQSVRIGVGWIRTTVGWRRIDLKELSQASGRAATESDRQDGGLEGQLVYGPDIFTYKVVAVTATYRGVVMAENIPGKADARAKTGRVGVFQSSVAAGASHAAYAQPVGARTVDQRILARVGEAEIEIADVAEVVVERADDFCAQPQIERERLAHSPIVLRKEREV